MKTKGLINLSIFAVAAYLSILFLRPSISGWPPGLAVAAVMFSGVVVSIAITYGLLIFAICFAFVAIGSKHLCAKWSLWFKDSDPLTGAANIFLRLWRDLRGP